MAKTKISEFSTTAGNNTDINSINIAEGCSPSGINDAIRELMRQLKEFQTGGAGDSVNSGGDFSVATNKFTVASASGNTSVAGTLGVTGTTTLTGALVANGNATLGDASGDTVTIKGTPTLEVNPTLSGGTANGVLYLNGSKVATSGSALTFDGSQLGVGVSPSDKLTVAGTIASRTTSASLNLWSTNTGASNIGFFGNGSYEAYLASVAGGGLLFGIGASANEAMRLTSTGLGVGTSSPGYKLDVLNSGATTWARIGNGGSNNGAGLILGGSSTTKNWVIANQYNVNGGLEFTQTTANGGSAIGASPAMTLDASGNLLVGTTAFPSASVAGIGMNGASSGNASSSGASTAAWNHWLFYNGNGLVGYISTSGSATTYSTSSDYRLKDNPQPLTGSGAFIDALKPKTWNWKADGSVGVGFIAHEVQEVSPGSVVGEKDGEQMQAMEYGSAEFIANIIAELQSLRARVAALES